MPQVSALRRHLFSVIKFASTLHTTLVYSSSSFSVYWRMLIEREVHVHTFVRPFTVLQTNFAADVEISDPNFTEDLTEKLLQVPSPVVNRLALGLDIARRSQFVEYSAKVFGRTMLIGSKA